MAKRSIQEQQNASMPRTNDEWLSVAATPTAADNEQIIRQAAVSLQREVNQPLSSHTKPPAAIQQSRPLIMPQSMPAHTKETMTKRMMRHAPSAVNAVSWVFNGAIAASLFAVMSAHDVSGCDVLPEPVRTNICGIKPR